MTRFRSVVLDVDSTLCGVEGIDWLAGRKGPDIALRVRTLTDRAMNGDIALDAVYGERLALIAPSRADIEELSEEYRKTVAPDAYEVMARLSAAGVRVALVSGGIRQAIQPLATDLGLELSAVELRFGAAGEYAGFDKHSPLARQEGKRAVVRALDLQRPSLAVGDGATDVFMATEVDRFVAFTGFVRRSTVVAQANGEVASFADVARCVLA